MLTTIEHDVRLQRLLQSLLSVRHSHLRPLLAVSVGPASIGLHHGQPGPCLPRCGGIHEAIRAIHEAGLWVGDLTSAVGFDEVGRVVLIDVGSRWDLQDPFRGHPSTRGESDLRIAWRQQSDLLQLANLSAALLRCETLAS